MSAWQDLVSASLLGTERVPVPAVPGPRPGIPADPAALVLDQAALLTAARRGGRHPERARPLAAAEPDPAPPVSRAAAVRLARMLGGLHSDLLPEWLAAVVEHGRLVPAALLPALLHQARRSPPAPPGLGRLAAAAGGPRARWLAALNPEWKFVLACVPAGEDAWRLGDAAQRRGYLSALRARDPGAARDLVTASWGAASADERVMFLDELADGLGLADEALLEAALDDRHARVREQAAALLAALPGSALAGRMAERAGPRLYLQLGLDGDGLVVSPPHDCDPAMRRDGITPLPAAARSPLAAQAMLMLDLMARTPLRTWTERSGLTPAEITGLSAGDWTPLLFTGWTRAAVAQSRYEERGRGAWEWMTALATWAVRHGLHGGSAAAAEALSQLARRADPRLGAPGALPAPRPDALPVLQDAVRVLRFRYEMHEELKDDNGAG